MNCTYNERGDCPNGRLVELYPQGEGVNSSHIQANLDGDNLDMKICNKSPFYLQFLTIITFCQLPKSSYFLVILILNKQNKYLLNLITTKYFND